MRLAVQSTVHLVISLKDNYEPTIEMCDGVAEFLAAAPNLQTLELSMGDTWFAMGDIPSIVLAEIVQGVHWKNLRHLGLSALMVSK